MDVRFIEFISRNLFIVETFCANPSIARTLYQRKNINMEILLNENQIIATCSVCDLFLRYIRITEHTSMELASCFRRYLDM